MKSITLFVLILAPIMLFGQQAIPTAQHCNCAAQFAFIKHEMEANYAGYRDKVNPKTGSAYTTVTSKTLDKVKKANKQAYCYAAIKEWLDFFKDGHVQLYSADIKDNDTSGLAERIKNTETLDLYKTTIDGLANAKGVEGIYVHNDSMYTVAVIRNKTDFRDYAAVIVNSKTPNWKAGQVKMELKKINDSTYGALLYYRDHSYHLLQYNFDGSSMNKGEWTKTNAKQVAENTKAVGPSFEYNNVLAKKLDDSTLYIQIGSFSTSNAAAIDSVFKANAVALKSTPNLIIDLRNNGGGADFAFEPILAYIYTNPVKGIGNDVWATPDNADNLMKYLNDPDLPKDNKKEIKELAERVRQNAGKFIMHAEDDTMVMDKVEPYPKKVAILINKYCASTTEEFLLIAKQSKKVTLMGEHTWGELDYSNLLQATSPCAEIGLYYASTKSRRMNVGQGIDNIGIMPNVPLSGDKDWITEAKKYLEK